MRRLENGVQNITRETLLRVQNRLLEMNLDELKAKSEQVKSERNADVGEAIDETEKNIKEIFGNETTKT